MGIFLLGIGWSAIGIDSQNCFASNQGMESSKAVYHPSVSEMKTQLVVS